MRKVIFGLSAMGFLGAAMLAYVSSITEAALTPAFTPATNPFKSAIYANGIVESEQPSGSNVTVYPEVAGTVTKILVSEGQAVEAGTPLLEIEDSIQRATVEQLRAQAEAAFALLRELRAEPRPEALDVAEAQVAAARAALRTVEDAVAKQQAAFALNPRSISKDALDSAVNAVETARANLVVVSRQRDLTKAGAWIYDIHNQERQYEALVKAQASAKALLGKYRLHAPGAGQVLAIGAAVGGFVSPQGTYNSYTQGMSPVIVLGTPQNRLHIRCYVDEILLPRLPSASTMKAQLSIRGSSVKIPLQFVSIQPLVSPKISLSDQRLERVDVRVLPVIFRLAAPPPMTLYPGQLVDVYIGK